MTSRRIKLGAVLAVCAASVAPGAATAQTTPASRPTESKDVTTMVSDSWVTAKTKIALFADDRVAGTDVGVTTVNGVVTLTGKVESSEAKTAAEQVARGIEGVRQVQNNLQVVAPQQRERVDARDDEIVRRVEQQIARDSRFRKADIDVAANNGVVRLTGDVETIGTSAAASEVARRVAGVRSVRNEITVKRDDRMMGREPRSAGEPRGIGMDRDSMRNAPGMADGRGSNVAERDRVRRVQEALKDKGHDPGDIDGMLGPQTQQAIREFQKAENLPSTGRLDGQTLSRLGIESTGATGRPQAR